MLRFSSRNTEYYISFTKIGDREEINLLVNMGRTSSI